MVEHHIFDRRLSTFKKVQEGSRCGETGVAAHDLCFIPTNMRSNIASWRRAASGSRSPAARLRVDRDRSRRRQPRAPMAGRRSRRCALSAHRWRKSLCACVPTIAIALPRHAQAIGHTPLLPATVHDDTPTITAIAAQASDERSRTLGISSGSTTQGVQMRLRAAPVPFLPRTETTIGGLSQRATSSLRVLRRVRKATTTRAVPNHEVTGRRIRTLHRQVHEPRRGTMIAYRWVLIAVADPPPCRLS
jgi:hypothetical protein